MAFWQQRQWRVGVNRSLSSEWTLFSMPLWQGLPQHIEWAPGVSLGSNLTYSVSTEVTLGPPGEQCTAGSAAGRHD